jgi:outer membrane lipoprotein-sorting protein
MAISFDPRRRTFLLKRELLIALTILLGFLTGCVSGGSGDREKLLKIREKYLAAKEFVATAQMVADYGDRVYNYKLTYVGDGAKGEMSVLEPQNIKGLRALIDGSDVILKYDGALLETGVFSKNGISPIEAFPLMINAWENGFITAGYRERLNEYDCLVAEIDMTRAGETDALLQRVWFASDTGLPVKAEIRVNGFTVINCDFEDAQLR